MRWNYYFCILLITLTFPSGCKKSTSLQSPDKKIVRISLPTEPPTLDWNLATDNVSYQILNQLMEGLTQYDDQLNPIPAVSKSWEVLDEGKTYIFHLDSNYQWSDGKPVTAEDFRYSWLRLLNPKTGAEYAYFLFDIVGAQEFNSGQLTDESQVGIIVVDEATLKVQLKKTLVFFPAITTFMVTYPLRKDVVEKYGTAWTEPKNLITCGPFVLKEWWHEYRLHLAANSLYGGIPQPQIKDLIIYLVSDPSTALSLYETNQLDVAIPPPIALPLYQHHPEMIHLPQLRGYYFGFNIHKKPFDDPRIRQAFAMSLNKKEIPNILKGGELAVNSWIPPGMFGFNEEIGLKFDPKKAKELLAQIKLPVITLSFNSDPVNKKIAEWAQDQWKKNLGVSVELKNEEWKSYLASLKNDPPQLFRLGWGADYPDPDNFMNLFTTFSGNNHTGWTSHEFDQLISQGAMENNSEKRLKIYNQAQKLLLEEEAVIIPLFVSNKNILVKKHLHPFPLLPVDFAYFKKIVVEE